MKTMVIIGGGVAGLTAGIFAQKNGFSSTILEKNPIPGGECTGWDRRGYHIDGCIHWLMGTDEGSSLNSLWKTVGALEDTEIYHPESFLSFEHETGTVHFFRDLEKLQRSWTELSPEDEEVISQFCRVIRQLHSFTIDVEKPVSMMSIREKIRYFSSMKDAGMVMKRYGKISLREYAKRFTHPALRAALTEFLPEGYSSTSVMFALAAFSKNAASMPMGGSRAFSLRMAERYRELGGTLKTSCEAASLDISGSRVSRVICSDGTYFEADYVIAACDASHVLTKLLEGKYQVPAFTKRFKNPKDYPLASEILIALGCKGSLEEYPRSMSFAVDPFEIHGKTIERIKTAHFHHEPGYAPDGHGVMICDINQFSDDVDAWSALAEDRKTYRKEKQRIAEAVRRAVESRMPELEVTVLDVVTPKTYERYCNAHRGAFMAFLPTVKGKPMNHTGKIKGLNNFYLSGQWLQPPGGLPTAVMTGKYSVMYICRQEKQSFIS